MRKLNNGTSFVCAVVLAASLYPALTTAAIAQAAPESSVARPVTEGDIAAKKSAPGRFVGMDQSVNVDLAEKAGAPAREPYINVEKWGDLWNLLLLLGGGACGFVIGRYWDHIWGRRRAA